LLFAQKIEKEKPLNPPPDILISEFPTVEVKKDLDLTALSAIVLEKQSRTVVYRKEENARFAPASATKIMTALVALSYYPQSKILTANKPEKIPGSKMGLVDGERMQTIDLLYGLLLPSGNDAAYVLAQNYPGGIPAFVEAMNQKAKELFLFNTHFVDPAGYEDDNTTTAYDLARLAAYAIDNSVFSKIVSTKQKEVFDVEGKISHKLENLNELLDDHEVTGVKTGFTNEAGGVLVTSVNRGGKTFITVVLKSKDRFWDTQNLIRDVIKRVRFIKL
jgi:D-alanyl-D-alanine carboxypeptidase (penicillin-binding protein 5/6)